MLELYGEGLERIVHALEAAPEVRDGLAGTASSPPCS